MATFRASAALRGFFGGSGKDLMGTPAVAAELIALSGKAKPVVLYLGTATYDLPGPRDSHLISLREAGCDIRLLEMCRVTPPETKIKESIESADIILVCGGNTLWAIDRLHNLGIPDLLREAMTRGAVLSGGSAGAICWFDGGHSDSMDPHTYFRTPYLFTGESGDGAGERPAWKYIRVPGLGFLPGLICPHHDRVQSNGVPRAADIDHMLLRHPTEQGLCIDHHAALVVEGDNYRVFTLPDKDGSVMENGELSLERGGKPGLWLKSVGSDGKVTHAQVPQSGSLSELLRVAVEIVEDTTAVEGRRENPQPSPEEIA